MNLAETQEWLTDVLWPGYQREKVRLDRIDKWWRWEHPEPAMPRERTQEFKELAAKSPTPWLDLVVTMVAQGLEVGGYRSASETGWKAWQGNGLDGRQTALYRSAEAYGAAYGAVGPGQVAGESMAVIQFWSPRQAYAVFDDPAVDEWPMVAMRVRPTKNGHLFYVYTDSDRWVFQHSSSDATGRKARLDVRYDLSGGHNLGVCPVRLISPLRDLEGRSPGVIEPLIPIASRINQDVFDRLVIQRFAAWVVRTISGLTLPDESDPMAEKLRLSIEKILVAEDPDTRFGSLPATPVDGALAAESADIRTLAAVSQTPAFAFLLEGLANPPGPEGFAAAISGHEAKKKERRRVYGEHLEALLRLACKAMGDPVGATDWGSQMQWEDTDGRGLAAGADGVAKLSGVGIPVEFLLRYLPGLSQQDQDEIAAALRTAGAGQVDLTAALGAAVGLGR